MIVPDVNLLLYAHFDAFPLHEPARKWWEAVLTGPDAVGLAPVVAFGFVRIATNRRVFEVPMQPHRAMDTVEGWLGQPNVQLLSADGEQLRTAFSLMRQVGVTGDLTTDAQIAAHAVVASSAVATNDTDFTRFPGLSTHFPLS